MFTRNPAYLVIVGLVVVLLLLPALLAGGGLIIGLGLAAGVVLLLVGGPEAVQMLWDRHIARSQGEKAGMNFRDAMSGYSGPSEGDRE